MNETKLKMLLQWIESSPRRYDILLVENIKLLAGDTLDTLSEESLMKELRKPLSQRRDEHVVI